MAREIDPRLVVPGSDEQPYRPIGECVGDPCVTAIETLSTRPTRWKATMTHEPIRPALPLSFQALEAEAATEILRMLTSDATDAMARSRRETVMWF